MSRIGDQAIAENMLILSIIGGRSGGMPATLHYPRRRTRARVPALKFPSTSLFALARAVTSAPLGRAVAWFSDFSVRTDARLGMHAPEQAVVRTLHVRISLGEDELP